MAATTNQCFKCSGTDLDLFLLSCRHASVCRPCGASMKLAKESCGVCGETVDRLIKECPVRVATEEEHKYFVGVFPPNGSPDFQNNHNWSLSDVDQLDPQNEKKGPWILKDESSSTEYTSLTMDPARGKSYDYFGFIKQEDGSFVAVPLPAWSSFTRNTVPVRPIDSDQADKLMAEHMKKDEMARTSGVKRPEPEPDSDSATEDHVPTDDEEEATVDTDDDADKVSSPSSMSEGDPDPNPSEK